MTGADLDLIRIFDHDPDLLEGLDAPVAAHLRQRFGARRTWVEPGRWEPAFADDEVAGHLGLLVIDGLLIHTINLGGRDCSEVVGPGDLIRPWDRDDLGSVPCHSTWRALQPLTLAVLDDAFALRIARWPSITSALLARGTRRSRMLVYQATIAHVRHAETRVLLALWHLGDRWGKVTADGIRVPVPLTHQLLAQITCLQRPTVSAAVSALADAGQIARTPEGGWLLRGEPPTPDAAPPRRPATGLVAA